MARTKKNGLDPQTDNSCYLGVDPGMVGGLAVLCGTRVAYTPMPRTDQDIIDWLESNTWLTEKYNYGVIEQVHSFPGQGVASTFKFGMSYGALRMCLIALQIPYETVSPQKWQKAVGLSTRKKEGRTEHKNRLKARAQELFPKEKITLATADALLLAYYCRLLHRGL